MSRERPARMDIPTIRDVAKQAGVSTATVSRVLSGTGRVRRELAERVLQTAAELNFQPNRAARSLRSRVRKTVGIVVPDIENPLFGRLIRGIEDVLTPAGFTILLGHYADIDERERVVVSAFEAESIAGLIFVNGANPGGCYARLNAAGIPVVAVLRQPVEVDVDRVTIRDADASRDAVLHLVSRGHRRIALIDGSPGVSTSALRRTGYESALRESSIPLDPKLIVQADWRFSGGKQAMRQLLSLPEPPSAVFAVNGLMTLGALACIWEQRLRIPEDIAIVGFDDMEWATSLQPNLTALVHPAYEMGALAAQMLLERIRVPSGPVQQAQLECRLKIGGSCGPTARAVSAHAG